MRKTTKPCEKPAKITRITENSIAAELGISSGSELISVNGNKINDIFDYRYCLQDEYIEVLIRDETGGETLYEIEKDYYEDIGLEFESGLMDGAKGCKNKCIFCFIDQLPKGMRKTLYFKDDDSRLSFLSGNYVTLTNMTDAELNRIIFYRLSPINISVHTTDLRLRRQMLKNPRAGEILNQIGKLAAAGITMNFQIVLCRGVNDGTKLDETIKTLVSYMPNAVSLSVVPAGQTAFRENLYPLTQFTEDECAEIVKKIHSFQQEFLQKYATRFVYAADEFYINAKLKFPAHKTYEDFYQIENGVGMAAQTLHCVSKALRREKSMRARRINNGSGDATEQDSGVISCAGAVNEPACQISKSAGGITEALGGISKSAAIITGEAAYSLMEKCRDMITAVFPLLNIRVYKIENKFFGGGITVSGLLTGTDIINSLKGANLEDILLLPENVLRAGYETAEATANADVCEKPVSVSANADTCEKPVSTSANADACEKPAFTSANANAPKKPLRASSSHVFLDDITGADIEKELKRPVYFCGDDNFLNCILSC
ncbi:MAG: DUF512 domain-containing protein [Clostridiales bacterium]|jgi:putative radical SAM enzyme (TIGR03279 family)|nr:DUF512 domain-containing protein [Clostridiales bacterium]